MTQHDLKPGDLVKLKSGGPTMTYEGTAAMTGEALCIWFSSVTRSATRCREAFAYATLERVSK